MAPELLNDSHMHDRDHARFSPPSDSDVPTLSCTACDVKLNDQREALAYRLLQEGKTQEAVTVLTTALAVNETGRLWNSWATAQYACGDLAQAETGYGRALDLNRSDRHAAVNLGLLLFAQGRIQEAMPLLEEHRATLTAQEKQRISELAAHFQAHQAQIVQPHVDISPTKMDLPADMGSKSALAPDSTRPEDQYLEDGLTFDSDQEELRGVTVNAHDNTPRTLSGIPTILNIGSGKDWKEEALNLDIQAEWTPDIVFDLNHPLPADGVKLTSARFGTITLKEDHFELIQAYDVLEHLSQLWTAMNTCLAWLKVGGVFRINVPYDLSLGAWQDPTHVRAFNENSWLYYTDWFWYLGWDRWRFDRVSLQYMLSPLGAKLKEQGSSDADLIRTPRAVDSMLVELRKRPLTDSEVIELNTRRPYRRNAVTPGSG